MNTPAGRRRSPRLTGGTGPARHRASRGRFPNLPGEPARLAPVAALAASLALELAVEEVLEGLEVLLLAVELALEVEDPLGGLLDAEVR